MDWLRVQYCHQAVDLYSSVNVRVEKPPDPEQSLFSNHDPRVELFYPQKRLLPPYLHKSDRLLGNKINIRAHDMI